jgi:hypothetical protein
VKSVVEKESRTGVDDGEEFASGSGVGCVGPTAGPTALYGRYGFLLMSYFMYVFVFGLR